MYLPSLSFIELASLVPGFRRVQTESKTELPTIKCDTKGIQAIL